MSHLIVSLDGGGIRGLLSAALIEKLEARQPFLSRVQLFAGTSTGGILALGLAAGKTPTELAMLYAEHGDRIFRPRDVLDNVAGGLDELWRADYGTEGLREVLTEVFEDRTLADLEHRVLIPTFDLERAGPPRTWRPKFLHNYPGPSSDGAVLAVDAALRTSAAPTYFPSHQGVIDGGVIANNPSACAIAKAVKAGNAAGQDLLPEIRLLSVGTGENAHYVEGNEHDWGKTQWAVRIVKLVLEGSPGVADYQCQQLLGHRYHRMQVQLPGTVELDDVQRAREVLPGLAAEYDTTDAELFVARATDAVA